jgi:hypothetical protein
MTNFKEKLDTEWQDAIDLLESIDFDCSDLETVEDLEEIFSELEIVENGVFSDDVEIYFTDEEEGKQYLRDNHVDVNMADSDEEMEELIDEFYFEPCGPYIANLNNYYTQTPVQPADTKILEDFIDWVEDWNVKEELHTKLQLETKSVDNTKTLLKI